MDSENEIILYQPDKSISLEVRLEDETVWLTQAQMAELFQTTPQNITIHIRSIYKEGELEKAVTCKEHLQVRQEGERRVKRQQKFYNLDVIISVGYRVKSIYGTRFRQWANKVLKEYLLRGYAINRRLEKLEKTVADHSEKIDFFVRTLLHQRLAERFGEEMVRLLPAACRTARTARKNKKEIKLEVTICDLKRTNSKN